MATFTLTIEQGISHPQKLLLEFLCSSYMLAKLCLQDTPTNIGCLSRSHDWYIIYLVVGRLALGNWLSH